MKKIKHLISLAFVFLISCETNKNISDDSRLAPFIGSNLIIKVPMNLYEIDPQRMGNENHYDLTKSDFVSDDIVGVVGVGNEVFFERAILKKVGGHSWERFEGRMIYKGKKYPVSYSIGLTSFPDKWRILKQDFERKN